MRRSLEDVHDTRVMGVVRCQDLNRVSAMNRALYSLMGNAVSLTKVYPGNGDGRVT